MTPRKKRGLAVACFAAFPAVTYLTGYLKFMHGVTFALPTVATVAVLVNVIWILGLGLMLDAEV